MRTVCRDASFLRALYGAAVHTPASKSEISRLQDPLLVTGPNLFEFANSVRFAECRKWLLSGQAAVIIAQLSHDLQSGKMVEASHCNLASVLTQAKRLSGWYTLAGGYRSFDILHVAAAVHLRADAFLTFDLQQRARALAEGLTVRP